MKITAEFIRSAASAADLPADGLPELAMVGRSNVGKSSLINALLRQRMARTSATPGKTRLANIFRVQRETAPAFYLVDLPGFGFARGRESAQEFEALTRMYFERAAPVSALLLVDARHPGLESDLQAWAWLSTIAHEPALVATKIDKLARGQRIRAMRELESVFQSAAVAVSTVTGEGLDELWKLIARLLNSHPPHPRSLTPRRTAPAPSTPKGPHTSPRQTQDRPEPNRGARSTMAASRQGRPTPPRPPRRRPKR